MRAEGSKKTPRRVFTPAEFDTLIVGRRKQPMGSGLLRAKLSAGAPRYSGIGSGRCFRGGSSESRKSRQAPETMEESAMLKSGQW